METQMDNDSTQPQSEQDKEIAQLQQLLSEAITAERFFEQDTGRLFTQLATAEINRAIRDITSDKYDKDHQGFILRKADMNAYKTMLRKMQLGASPIRKAKIMEKLDEPQQ